MTDYGRREADRDNASRLRILRQRRLRRAIAAHVAIYGWSLNVEDSANLIRAKENA